MKFLQKKDSKNRIIYTKKENKRIIIKFLLTNLIKKDSSFNQLMINKCFLKKNYFVNKTRIKLNNRCTYTGRSRGTYKYYGVSRFVLRDYMLMGLVPGYKKGVW